jgi:hypothetical protein
MKRILILLASLLVVGNRASVASCGYGAFGSADAFLPSDASDYKLLCDYVDCGLAVDEYGAWGAGCGFTLGNAEASSVRECQRHSSKPVTCRVVDLNQQSDFIKGGDEPIDTLFPAAPSPSAPTLKERLLDLRSLVDEGLITEEDYVQAKKQILDGM